MTAGIQVSLQVAVQDAPAATERHQQVLGASGCSARCWLGCPAGGVVTADASVASGQSHPLEATTRTFRCLRWIGAGA
jgi:hypothetical protein